MAKKCYNLLLAPIAFGLNVELNASDGISASQNVNLSATQNVVPQNETENPVVNATNLPISNDHPQSQTNTQAINDAFGTYTDQQTQNSGQTSYVSNTSDTELINKMFANQEQSQKDIPVYQKNQQKDSEIVNKMFIQNSQIPHQTQEQQEVIVKQNNYDRPQITDRKSHENFQNNSATIEQNGYMTQYNNSQNTTESYRSTGTNAQIYPNQCTNYIPAENFQGNFQEIAHAENSKIENNQFTMPQKNHEIAKENASDFIVKQAQDKITLSGNTNNSLQQDIKGIDEKMKTIDENISTIKENIEILTVALAENKTSSISQEKITDKEAESNTTSIDEQKNINSHDDTENTEQVKKERATTDDEEDIEQQEISEKQADKSNDQEEIDESDKNDASARENVSEDLSLILKEIKKVKNKVDNLDNKVDNLSQYEETNIQETSQQKEDNFDEQKKK